VNPDGDSGFTTGPAAADADAGLSGSATAAADGPPAPIEVRGLVKRYGELTAVGGVDLTVRTGDVYGYLGPNGAGKTTSLRMMLGLIRPTAGSVRLFGRDPMQNVRALEGVAGFVEAPTFYPYLSARKNLEMLAAYDGGGAGERIDEALDTVELTGRQRDRVGGFSHGMRQRLGIAAALLRDPKLLLLDEPATGLDPAGMRDMRLLIRRLADQGMTVLLSSHLLTEVEDVCNRVAIVRQGRIVYEGEIAELKRGAGTRYWLQTTDDERALAVCRAQPGVADVRSEQLDDARGAHSGEAGSRARGMRARLTFTADEPAAVALSQALVESGALIRAMAPQTVTLEDLFFSLTEGDGVPALEPAPASAPPSEPAETAR
jgi:ABC-2 type transport system ATP-binding protein